MYKNKKNMIVLMGIVLSFALSACASESFMTDTGSGSQKEIHKEDYLNIDALNAPQGDGKQGSYRVHTLEKGTYEEASLNQTLDRAYLNVPTVNLEIEDGTVQFGEYIVGNMFDYVDAGDVIATIYTEVDEVTIEEAQLKLIRLQERFAKAEADMVDRVADLQEEREEIYNPYELDRMDIEEEQIRLDWELEKRNYERDIKDATEKIAELKESKNTTQITAPVAGYVIFATKYSAGTELENGAYICNIVTQDDFFVQTNNFSEDFGFGMTMKFRNSTNDFGGTVISGGSRALYGNLDTGTTTFSIQSEDDAAASTMLRMNAMVMEGNMRSVNNVVLVPNEAVTVDGSNYYVTVLKEDGNLLKTEFIPGGVNAEQYWVYEGLDEGTQIVY